MGSCFHQVGSFKLTVLIKCWEIIQTYHVSELISINIKFPRGVPNLITGIKTKICIYNLYNTSKMTSYRWNPSTCKTRTHLVYIISILRTDVLATQGSRATATMILTMLSRNYSGPANSYAVKSRYTPYNFATISAFLDNKKLEYFNKHCISAINLVWSLYWFEGHFVVESNDYHRDIICQYCVHW